MNIDPSKSPLLKPKNTRLCLFKEKQRSSSQTFIAEEKLSPIEESKTINKRESECVKGREILRSELIDFLNENPIITTPQQYKQQHCRLYIQQSSNTNITGASVTEFSERAASPFQLKLRDMQDLGNFEQAQINLSNAQDGSEQSTIQQRNRQEDISQKNKRKDLYVKTDLPIQFMHQHQSLPLVQCDKILSKEKIEHYDQMEKRIISFLSEEGIQLQSVDDYLSQLNCYAFKNMSRLSPPPLKLDINKSPLRRHRANTIQL